MKKLRKKKTKIENKYSTTQELSADNIQLLDEPLLGVIVAGWSNPKTNKSQDVKAKSDHPSYCKRCDKIHIHIA